MHTNLYQHVDFEEFEDVNEDFIEQLEREIDDDDFINQVMEEIN